MSNTKTIRCSCYHEMLHLSWDEELNILDMSIWAPYSTNTTMSWKQRLRYCWQILTKGRPYGDQVVMEKEHIAELADFLVDLQNR
jgi:hypothetical protein